MKPHTFCGTQKTVVFAEPHRCNARTHTHTSRNDEFYDFMLLELLHRAPHFRWLTHSWDNQCDLVVVGCFLRNLNVLQLFSKYEQLLSKYYDFFYRMLSGSLSLPVYLPFLFIEHLLCSRHYARCFTFVISTVLIASLSNRFCYSHYTAEDLEA